MWCKVMALDVFSASIIGGESKSQAELTHSNFELFADIFQGCRGITGPRITRLWTDLTHSQCLYEYECTMRHM